ncbi:MAG: UPF0182 family protein, partial [Clostridia bacterium]|nr:UPF0182 family protein [Clostridia bacterium]
CFICCMFSYTNSFTNTLLLILFTNTAWFGQTDPVFNMDIGFYMFQAPLIRTTIILWINNYSNLNNICSCILHYSV